MCAVFRLEFYLERYTNIWGDTNTNTFTLLYVALSLCRALCDYMAKRRGSPYQFLPRVFIFTKFVCVFTSSSSSSLLLSFVLCHDEGRLGWFFGNHPAINHSKSTHTHTDIISTRNGTPGWSIWARCFYMRIYTNFWQTEPASNVFLFIFA